MMRSGIFCPPSPLKPAVLVPCFGGRRVRHDGAHSVAAGDTPWRVYICIQNNTQTKQFPTSPIHGWKQTIFLFLR